MTDLGIYLDALSKMWWLFAIVFLAILGTGLHEAIENKWDRRVK